MFSIKKLQKQNYDWDEARFALFWESCRELNYGVEIG